MSENSLSASETSNSQYLDDLANQNLNISQYLEGPTNPDLDIRQHLNDPTILSGCMVPVTIQSFTTDPDNITPTTIYARLCGFGWGAVQFIAFYDSQESQTPSGYALVRGMESDWTDKQIADYATTQVLREMPNTDESLKSLMLDAIEDFRQRSDQTRADNDALLGLLPFEQISPKYAETRDELLSQNGQEPTSAEIFEALVAKYSQNSNETEIVNTPAIEDANNNADSPEVTPATPRIRVAVTNNYAPDPSSPFYERYEMIKNSGALILPMDGKVTVWPSDVIEYLNKNYPDWDTDSYTEEEIAALQDTYSHFLNGDYLMQGSDNNTFTDTTKTDTTVNDTTDRTITLPGGLIVKLSDVLLVTDSLPDDTNTYFYRVSDYINPETGRLEDIPIPLYVCKNSEQVAFISTMDAETEAVTSVQVACADTDGWRTIGTLNPDGIDWKYKAGNLTGSGTASVVWHAQELGALGVWTDGTDNWTGIAGWFDANWTMLGCGDFDGDGKDSVLMSLSGGQFYSVDLDGTLTSLGGLNWSGWEFGAVGDFAGDGKDDVVLFHRESGAVVLLADGNADNYKSIGQLDATDWGIAGALDVDADGKDDLLVKQSSSGLVGAYASADMNRWSVVDSASEYYLA